MEQSEAVLDSAERWLDAALDRICGANFSAVLETRFRSSLGVGLYRALLADPLVAEGVLAQVVGGQHGVDYIFSRLREDVSVSAPPEAGALAFAISSGRFPRFQGPKKTPRLTNPLILPGNRTSVPERLHKELLVANFAKDRPIGQLVVKLNDVVGAIADVTAVLVSEGVDIRQSSSYAELSGNSGIFNSFVAPKPGYDMEQLQKKLRAIPAVLGTEWKPGVDNSVIDWVTYPVRFAGQRVILLGSNALVEMFGAIESVFGSGGSVIIYQQGKNYGRAMAMGLAKTFTKEYMVKNHLYGIGLIASMGWGIPNVTRANDSLTELIVQVDECTLCAKPAKGPFAGYFVAGSLAGIYSFLSGKELQGRETKCVANGDTSCVFHIS